MAKLSLELLEDEWIKYSGLKNFLKFKDTSFGYDMNYKYSFDDDTLLKLGDHDAYDHMKKNHAMKIENMK
jgi:hypothetical protein